MLPSVDFSKWEFLTLLNIEKSLPYYSGGQKNAYKCEDGIYYIGDAWTYPSLNGALLSGRMAAKEIAKNLN